MPTGYISTKSDSGKLAVLENLLHILHSTTCEKVVLVSNFTSTLNVLQNLLSSKNYSWCRLDGDTDQNKRQQIVDNFNRVDAKTCCTLTLRPAHVDNSCISIEFEEWRVRIEFGGCVKVSFV